MGKSKEKQKKSLHNHPTDSHLGGREDADMDIDRMVNEGLGGGNVTIHNGLIGHSTTDTMKEE